MTGRGHELVHTALALGPVLTVAALLGWLVWSAYTPDRPTPPDHDTPTAQASRDPVATTPADDVRLAVPPSDRHRPTPTICPEYPALPSAHQPSTAGQPSPGLADHCDDRAS